MITSSDPDRLGTREETHMDHNTKIVEMRFLAEAIRLRKEQEAAAR